MKISCQTPGATIKYAKNEASSKHVVVNRVDEFETKGQEYENLLAQKQNHQNALNLLKPQPAKANPFTPKFCIISVKS